MPSRSMAFSLPFNNRFKIVCLWRTEDLNRPLRESFNAVSMLNAFAREGECEKQYCVYGKAKYTGLFYGKARGRARWVAETIL